MDAPQAVLFDLDGTLVASADAIWDTYAHVMTAAGHALPPRADVERLIGRPLEALFVGRAPEGEIPGLARAYQARFLARGVGLVRLAPGATEALDALGAIPLAVVTNRIRETTELVLRALGVRERFRVVVAREDAPRLKPDPAPVLAACRALGVAPARAILVGDTDADALAARAAGARFVGVLNGHGTEAELRAAGARVLVPDLRALAREAMP